MKLTARDMNDKYKETSLSVHVIPCWGLRGADVFDEQGLATSVKIPFAVPAC
jgi:hypothetical protein